MISTLDGAPDDALPALHTAWPDLPWATARQAHGAFHIVIVLAPAAVIRLRTGRDHAGATRREVSVAAILASAGSPIPAPRGEPVITSDWSASLYEYVDGTALEPAGWTQDRDLVLALLQDLEEAASRHPQLRHRLPPVRSWCGGAAWPLIVEELTAGDPQLRSAARVRINALLDQESQAELALVHGDFGPHNILVGQRAPALIDTDHAAWADPAIDIAPLLTSYPCGDLAADLPAPLIERAVTHRRTLSLQVAAAASLHGDQRLCAHALGNFARRTTTESDW